MARRNSRNSRKKTYPTNLMLWLKEGQNGDFFSGLLAIDAEMLEELLERYYDGNEDTVSEYDENKAVLYLSVNIPSGDYQDIEDDEALLGSAKMDNPSKKKRKKKKGRNSKSRSRR